MMGFGKELDFGPSFFYRVLLPGAILAGLANPLLAPYLASVGANAADIQVWVVLVAAVVIGILLSALNDPIYQFYEGRRGWWGPAAAWRTRRWQRHVAALLAKAQDARTAGRTVTYDEIWSELRQFPEDDAGNPTATRPTKMGNILASYELYPERRYGMDSVFYWYRLWLCIDKDTREEVDRTWASTDALMYLAFGMAVLGVVYLATVASAVATTYLGAPWFIPAGDQARYAIGGVALVTLSYLPYWLSMPGHRKNGEFYKTLFDLYRSKLRTELSAASDAERKEWTALWSQLQYGVKPAADGEDKQTSRNT